MAITVNTLAEVQEANGYIVELGLEGTAHPANNIDRDQIRDELEVNEWYVRTGDSAEEQRTMMQIDKNIDHTRLPAYLILTDHPETAEEGVVIYLDDVDSEDEAWELLQAAISVMRANSESTQTATELAKRIIAEHGERSLAISAGVIQIIQFAS